MSNNVNNIFFLFYQKDIKWLISNRIGNKFFSINFEIFYDFNIILIILSFFIVISSYINLFKNKNLCLFSSIKLMIHGNVNIIFIILFLLMFFMINS